MANEATGAPSSASSGATSAATAGVPLEAEIAYGVRVIGGEGECRTISASVRDEKDEEALRKILDENLNGPRVGCTCKFPFSPDIKLFQTIPNDPDIERQIFIEPLVHLYHNSHLCHETCCQTLTVEEILPVVKEMVNKARRERIVYGVDDDKITHFASASIHAFETMSLEVVEIQDKLASLGDINGLQVYLPSRHKGNVYLTQLSTALNWGLRTLFGHYEDYANAVVQYMITCGLGNVPYYLSTKEILMFSDMTSVNDGGPQTDRRVSVDILMELRHDMAASQLCFRGLKEEVKGRLREYILAEMAANLSK